MRCIFPRVSPCDTAAVTEFLYMLARGHGGRVSVLSMALRSPILHCSPRPLPRWSFVVWCCGTP
eukprot:1645720-Prymnesium_polylepis.1